MSDTPRTDAAIALTSQYRYDDSFGDPEFGWVTAGFARTLERDLAAAQGEVAQLQHDLAAAQDEIAQLGREQYAAERELDAARQRETVAIASWDEERGRALREGARVVEWIARADRAEAELAAARGERDAANQHCKILNDSNDAKARLIEAQIADLAALRSKLAL